MKCYRRTMAEIYDELTGAANPCAFVDWAMAKLYDEAHDLIRHPRPEDVAAWEAWEELPSEERQAQRDKKIDSAEWAANKRREEAEAERKAAIDGAVRYRMASR